MILSPLNYIFVDLYVKYFLSVKEAYIQYKQDYIRVVGINETDELQEDNGAGKSVLFVDAPLYALTGKTARGMTDSEVFHDLRPKEEDSIVRLNIIYCGEKYKIEWVNSDLKVNDETINKRAAKTYIYEKLGLDFDILMSTIFFTNKKDYEFTSRSPSGRKDYIENLSNRYVIDTLRYRLDKYNAYLMTRLSLIDRCTAKISGQVSSLDQVVKDFKVEFNVAQLMKDISDNQKKLDDLNNDVKDQDKAVLNKEYFESQDTKSTQNNKKNNVDKDIVALKEELKSLQEGVCFNCKKPYKNPKREAEIGETLKRKGEFVKNVDQNILAVEKTISDVGLKIQKLDENLTRIDKLASSLQTENLKLEDYNRLTQYKQSIKKLQVSLDRFNQARKEKDNLRNLCQQFKTLLGRDLKGVVLQDYLKNVELELDNLSPFLGKKITFELKGNALNIYSNGRLFEKLSEGEAKRSDLIIKESFKRLHNKKTNYYPYDEIFDGLDQVGIKACIAMIDSVHESSENVFTVVISHNPVVHDNLMLARPVNVIKREGFSFVEGLE